MAEPEQEEIVEEPAVVVLEKRYNATLPQAMYWVRDLDSLPRDCAEGSFAIVSEHRPIYNEERQTWFPDPQDEDATMVVLDHIKGWIDINGEDSGGGEEKISMFSIFKDQKTSAYYPIEQEYFDAIEELLGMDGLPILVLTQNYALIYYYYAEPQFNGSGNVTGYYFSNGRRTLLVGTDLSITEVND